MIKQKLPLLPDDASVNSRGHLVIGGCDTGDLASEFGTPLYVFDEVTLRRTCAEYLREFGTRYAETLVIYAAKAFLNRALAQVLKEDGLGLDVVSGGEIAIAASVNFPLEKAYFHGNNKQKDEIELAISRKLGRVVVDNLHELFLLNEAAKEAGVSQDVLIRLNPGIDPHTHKAIATGVVDSKFGFLISSGQAEEALEKAMSASNLNLVGLHSHIGSLIPAPAPYVEAIGIVFRFAAEMKKKHGFAFREFNCGGGFPIQYTVDSPNPPLSEYAQAITASVIDQSKKHGFDLPRLIIEPGRSIVGRAGVSLYTVGAIKDIPGVRRYVSVDGGMADNIRPAIYGSRYEAIMANKANADDAGKVTIAGKYCESGDILVQDVSLPELAAGDLIALPAAGAYCISMSSNYNAALKPAIVMVKEGKARLIRRRETYEDLMRGDV